LELETPEHEIELLPALLHALTALPPTPGKITQQ
jgi:hypothetical protein